MIILGSTGSIGVNTLNIVRDFGLSAEVLVAGENVQLLKKQIEEFSPKIVVVGSKSAKDQLGSVNAKLFVGAQGIENALNEAKGRLVVNAMVGYRGLAPTLQAISQGKKVALANKESLVTAGKFIDTSRIIPIDSEHFGLWYLNHTRKASKMTITASGGAFRDRPLEEIANASIEDALAHPNWSMGKKITIDSATMANKLFELLEARWLFGEEICYDAIIETRSIIHALIEFSDGVTTAQLSPTDMRLPIAYALLGELDKPLFPPVDLLQTPTIEFRPIEKERYPLWELKDEILQKPELGVVLNAANEIAVEKFLAKKIPFGEISSMVIKTFNQFAHEKISSVDDVVVLDAHIRKVLNG